MSARLLTALLALSLGAAACSSSEPDQAGPTLPPVTAAPTPTAEPVPREAAEATPEGAAEFAKFFYAEVERAYAERDPALIERLSAPGCTACERFLSSVTELRDEDQRSEGLVYEIISAVAPELEGDTARVDVVYNGPEVVRFDAQGNMVNNEPAVEFVNEQVNLVLVNGSWRVQEVLRP